jgi:peptidoglycan/LPS O-acetylase OafA/YrhL
MGELMNSSRRYDLDWLRVLAVLLLIPFHSALIFVLNPQSIMYIKDTVNSPFLDRAAGFVHLWHMPLLLFIAGASSWFSLQKRSAGTYIKERVQRLLIPFLFGVIVLLPPMTYIHLIVKPDAPTYWQHFQSFFTLNTKDLSGLSGGITPAHLWFILYLFIFSCLAAPLFVAIRNQIRKQTNPKSHWFDHPVFIYLWFIPLALLAALNILDDKNPLYYFLVFFLGFLFMSNKSWDLYVRKYTWLSIILAAVVTILIYTFPDSHYPDWSPVWILSGTLYHAARWIWVLVILSLGARFLNKGNEFLSYANQAAFPFYILHLPINTIVGWLIIKLTTSIVTKYIVIVLLSTLITWLIYEFIVKKVKLFSILLGIK